MAKLKTVMDGNEQFMGGHQIVNARTYKREIPAWALSKRGVQQVLLRSFPRLNTDETQRDAAGRWSAVIHLYFKMGYTRSQIAEELGSTVVKIHGIIRSIYRVSKGLRANGTGVLSVVRGRPKKKRAL